MAKKWLHPHAFIITLLLLSLIGAASLVDFRLFFLNPLGAPTEEDYDITDILYSQVQPRNADPDPQIVLVNVGSKPDYGRVAGLLERLLPLNPRAVGVDILFEDKPNPDTIADSLLREIVQAYGDRIVLASERMIEPDGITYRALPLMSGLVSDVTRVGFVNLPYYDPLATIRFFEPFCPGARGDTLRSFVAQLALISDPQAAAQLEDRGLQRERIHFSAGDDGFFVAQAEDILSDSAALNPDLFRDRIVLVGFVGSGSADDPITDRHYTPMNPRFIGNSLPDMAGLTLHANILRMVLDGHYVRHVPLWFNLLMAFLLCYFSLLFLFLIDRRLSAIYPILARLYQMVQIALLFVIIAWCYHAFRLRWDFSLGITAVALAVDGQIVYFALVGSKRRQTTSPDQAIPSP